MDRKFLQAMRVRAARVLRLLIVPIVFSTHPAFAEDWLPIDADELKMTSVAAAPGAPAVYLYRQVDRDDSDSTEFNYVRVKILNNEGRKYGDVEVVYDAQREGIRAIAARTIRPDGSIANFDGTVYDKPVIRGPGVKAMSKTFTLPDVQVGSIVEYRYRVYMNEGYIYDSHWEISTDLYTADAKFSLVPSPDFSLTWSWPHGLPKDAPIPTNVHGRIRLEAKDIPAFATEEDAPPEEELKYRVDFLYTDTFLADKDPDTFWKHYGKRQNDTVNDYINRQKAMAQVVAQTVAPGDSLEVMLRKLYERTQKLRNISFERDNSDEELKRQNYKDPHNVEELWNNGGGNGSELTWLYLALARAAGAQADAVMVPLRSGEFFNKRVMNASQLNSNVVRVTLGDRQLYLDPGVPFVPFGQLPWSETAVPGLALNKDGGTWVVTPFPTPQDSQIKREALVTLSPSGSLQGKLTVTFSGAEAQWRRMQQMHEDDTARAKFLEQQLKEDIPTGIEVKLTNAPDWASSSPTLVAEFDLSVPGWAAPAGNRRIMPIGLFSGVDQHRFEHVARTYPLYFEYPYQYDDSIVINLPSGWQASNMPPPVSVDHKVVTYSTSVDASGAQLTVSRKVMVNLLLLDIKFYPPMRDFFQSVRSGDEAQVVVSPAAATPVPAHS